MDHTPTSEAPATSRVTMTREQISERLREVALFQGLGREDLDRILDISEAVRVQGNDYVFEEGEQGDHFFVIVQGRIELRKATGEGFKKLAILKAGQAFGEMALLNQTPRSASAYAMEATYLLSVSREAFGRMLGGDTLAQVKDKLAAFERTWLDKAKAKGVDGVAALKMFREEGAKYGS